MLPRNHRNNNPLNLRPLTTGTWQGQTGLDPDGRGGNYVIFSSTWEGWRAAGVNVLNYRKNHGIKTVAGIISRWAPATDRNDVQGYIADVARKMKLDPDAAFDVRDRLSELILYMARHEGGAWSDFDPERDAGVTAAKQAVR